MDALNDPIAHVFDVEDRGKLDKILGQQYHVVVGNPPYIVVRDKALNQAYRDKYPTCHMKYSLGVPFTERFFDLTLAAQGTQPAGYMGMITANSFMKREFGKKLIEEYLPHKDLTHVIDTSGAYIPGHGTPTVILFARNQMPKSTQIRAVLGIRGEPNTPENASDGKVWCSIVGFLEKPGNDNDFVSVVDQERGLYNKHPWSMGGGGASELRESLEIRASNRLIDKVLSIGFLAITGEDDIFVAPKHIFERENISYRDFGTGENIRDWKPDIENQAFFPYKVSGKVVSALNISEITQTYTRIWNYRIGLKSRVMFGKTPEEHGHKWYGYMQHIVAMYRNQLSIVFAEVASHNHFVLDRGGKVFKQTAPVIKLSEDATEKDHLALLGLLNSSTAGFWMKQVSHQKQMTGGDGVRITDRSKVPFQFAGTALKKLPIPATFEHVDTRNRIIQLATKADALAQKLGELAAEKVLNKALKDGTAIQTVWENAITAKSQLRSQLIVIQEELDWTIYHAYGLCESDLLADISSWRDVFIEAGQRPFEIVAGINQDGFEVAKTIPMQWPADMQAKWQQRIEAIRDNHDLAIIEDPHYKRRWIGRQGLFNHSARSNELQNALREWLLDHLEKQTHAAELLTCAQLADRVRNDNTFQQVATLYTGTDTFDTQTLASQLVEIDNVPQMAAARYKPKAIPKFRAWQETWDKQRAEDAIDARTELDHSDPQYLSKEKAAVLKAREIGDIPLPPQYATADFRKPSYWPLRGKLDVPKERFFSMPHSEKSGDNTLVIGWAGLNHLQRAQAIAVWYIDRKEQDGWDAEQLKPMLVALDELIPWLKQWHNEIDPEYGERLGDYYEGFLLEELRQLQLSRDELLIWEPSATQRGAGRRRKTS